MGNKEFKIETGRLGFRSKTWAVLIIAILQGLNFLLSCRFVPTGSTQEKTGLVGWLVITTLGAIAGAVAEARRKPVNNEFYFRIRTGDQDGETEIEQGFNSVERIESAAGDLSSFIGSP